jgi:hypothetical protein
MQRREMEELHMRMQSRLLQLKAAYLKAAYE